MMRLFMAAIPPQVELLMARASTDNVAWGALLTEHQDRLCRIVAFRLDPRLQGRVDPADVVQDVFVEAAAHRERYFAAPSIPLFLWLRGIVGNKLLEIHRHHLGTRMRDAAREIGGHLHRAAPDDTSTAIVAHLAASATGPGTAAARDEINVHLHNALNKMEPGDREVLALRHFEQLTSAETAQVLGIEERAAAKRYLRALARLRASLAAMPGGLTGLRP
jgi:RNA polymerase sigma-70 factor (ECF subfamily)